MRRGLTAIASVLMVFGTAPSDAQTSGRLLVTSKQTRVLSIVDGASLKVMAQVPVGEDPHEVIVGPDGRNAYVSNFGEGTLHTITVIRLDKPRRVKTIDLSPFRGPHGLAFRNGALWFTAVASKALGSLDPVSGKLGSVLGTGQDNTHMLWIAPDGQRIVASSPASGTMSIFEPVISAPKPPPGAPVPPASYTYQGWKQSLVSVGLGSEGFDVTRGGGAVWTGNAQGVVSIVNLSTKAVEATFQLPGTGVNRLKLTPDGRLALITTRSGKELIVVDTRSHTVVKQIPIQQRGASGIQIEPNGNRAFIACPRDHYVAVVDLRTLEMTARIDVGREPDGLAWWSGRSADDGLKARRTSAFSPEPTER